MAVIVYRKKSDESTRAASARRPTIEETLKQARIKGITSHVNPAYVTNDSSRGQAATLYAVPTDDAGADPVYTAVGSTGDATMNPMYVTNDSSRGRATTLYAVPTDDAGTDPVYAAVGTVSNSAGKTVELYAGPDAKDAAEKWAWQQSTAVMYGGVDAGLDGVTAPSSAAACSVGSASASIDGPAVYASLHADSTQPMYAVHDPAAATASETVLYAVPDSEMVGEEGYASFPAPVTRIQRAGPGAAGGIRQVDRTAHETVVSKGVEC